MRLTIFWRAVLVQLLLIVLVVAVSLFVISQLRKQSELQTNILAGSTACVFEERRLLDTFLSQKRSVEEYLRLRAQLPKRSTAKYLSLQDQVFSDHFTQGSKEFNASLDKIATLIKTPEEGALVGQIRTLYARYANGLASDGALFATWKQEREELSNRIMAAGNELIRLGEARMKAEAEVNQKKTAAIPPFFGWLLAGGIGVVAAFLYFDARSMSRPLRQLAQEMEEVGRGELHHSLPVSGSSEVAEVTRSFNTMVERLAELDEGQADFLAQMSHELRTPLTAIQEGAALLLEEVPGALNASQREIVQVVQMNSDRLFRRLASVLDLSKMEAREMEYVFVPTDLVILVRRSVEAIGPIAQKKELQIELHTSTPLPVVSVDEDRIRQVLDNLLNNAVKFTPKKGAIWVATALRYDPDTRERWAEVSVSDTGVGVAPGDVERIFQKFYQSSSSHRQASRGSGLGLAIARHVVEAHGGKIWVESPPGEGATFIFTLPLRRGKEQGPKREARARRNGGRNAT